VADRRERAGTPADKEPAMHHSFVSVRSTAASPLEEVDAAFFELAAGPWPLRLPAGLVTARPGVPDLPVDEVRARLAHPGVPAGVRARVWGEVVRRFRERGEPWATVAVGLAVPGLRRALARLPGLAELDRAALERAALAAVGEELAAVDAADPEIGVRLIRAGELAGHRLVHAALRERRRAAGARAADALSLPGAARAYAVVERAVGAGVLSPAEGELITRTRLDGERVAAVAARQGISSRQLCVRRAVAERRLTEALRVGAC
jgi:hypothetical protein